MSLSSAEAERRRRLALEALKAKSKAAKSNDIMQNGHTKALPLSHPSTPQSPDSILVPPSSSPVHSITPRQSTSKYFASNGSTSAAGSASRQSFPTPTHSSIIPSSMLNANSANASAPIAGTPQSVMSAIINRKSSEDQPRDTAQNSLSYENANGSQPDSPTSPAPLSRLKPKYAESPTSPLHTSPPSATSRGSISRTPSLIGAAKALQAQAKARSTPQEEEIMEGLVGSLGRQFSNMRRDIIRDIVKRHRIDPDAAVIEVQEMSERMAAGSSSSHALSPLSRPLPSSSQLANLDHATYMKTIGSQFGNVPKSNIQDFIRKHGTSQETADKIQELSENLAQRTLSSSSASSSTGTSRPSPAHPYHPPNLVPSSKLATSSPLASPVKQPKPRKNEKSRIYANRDRGNRPDPDDEEEVSEAPVKLKKKRKDPDESESEAGENASDAESDEGSWSGDEGRRKKRFKGGEDELDAEGEALKAFNEVDEAMLTGTIACSAEQAAKIITLRPYESVDDAYTKLNKARGVSFKLFEQYTEIMEGYVQIDSCLNKCESIAMDVSNTLAIWRGAATVNDSVTGTPRSDGMNDVKVDVAKVDELLKEETNMKRRKILSQYIRNQPDTLGEGTVLKDYQLLGVNWLNLLYSKKIGCILADEMGLGKTIQVIAFLAHLKERGIKGPHMIFVPASTLENWIREFEKFGPGIDVQTYYGTQQERAFLRDELKRAFRKGRLQVVLASYTQVASPDDLSFFRKKIQFETCIYDEGHRLKSCTTKAYSDLMSIKPRWRCLLTGTPLQNNLQELVSLLMFIHKDVFHDAEPYLRAIFKSQGHANLLSQQRVSRARKMLTPFVLRRRKAHVLDLPPKIETVETCEMTPVQAKLYSQTLQRSKKLLAEMDDTTLEAEANAGDDEKPSGAMTNSKAKSKAADKKKGPSSSSSSNILMDLRKAASHPLLFRRLYTDAKVKAIAKECLRTSRWCDSNFDYVVEDLEIMSDAELHHFCEESEYPNIKKHALSRGAFLEGGKVNALRKHIERCKAEGKRMLLFSQFVMILDILQVALQHLDIKYTRLDGSTKTDERQMIVDEFTDDPDITVFLLSTKAGGVGINLVAASVVVIYDQDFNPHNDRQAADRAYRIGQEKDVEVIKLISKDSIDEDMLAIGVTKLQLDDAVGGEEVTTEADAAGPSSKDDKTAREVKKSLLTTLRNKFEAKDENGEAKPESIKVEHRDEDVKEEEDVDMGEPEKPEKKKARGGPALQV